MTPAQLDANRRNGQKSRGPKTQTGKTLSSRNALRHGLLSSGIVIDNGDGEESRAEFEDLLRGLLADLSPEGMLENLLVERIASCYWRLKRAVRCETGETQKRLLRAKSGGPENEDERDTLVRYFRTISNNFTAPLGEQAKTEKLLAEAQLRSLSLPDEPALDRILRYETTIERQLYRALEQLERLQRQRKGDVIPPPLRLNIGN